jgi:hypothetical protein
MDKLQLTDNYVFSNYNKILSELNDTPTEVKYKENVEATYSTKAICMRSDKNGYGHNVILIDSSLSSICRKFLLIHEYGHIKYSHLANKGYLLNLYIKKFIDKGKELGKLLNAPTSASNEVIVTSVFNKIENIAADFEVNSKLYTEDEFNYGCSILNSRGSYPKDYGYPIGLSMVEYIRLMTESILEEEDSILNKIEKPDWMNSNSESKNDQSEGEDSEDTDSSQSNQTEESDTNENSDTETQSSTDESGDTEGIPEDGNSTQSSSTEDSSEGGESESSQGNNCNEDNEGSSNSDLNDSTSGSLTPDEIQKILSEWSKEGSEDIDHIKPPSEFNGELNNLFSDSLKNTGSATLPGSESTTINEAYSLKKVKSIDALIKFLRDKFITNGITSYRNQLYNYNRRIFGKNNKIIIPREKVKYEINKENLIFLIDVSSSMDAEFLTHCSKSILEFYKSININGIHRLISCNTKVQEDVDLDELDHQLYADGGTALANGIHYINEYYQKKDTILFILSDLGDYLDVWDETLNNTKYDKVYVINVDNNPCKVVYKNFEIFNLMESRNV